MIKGPYYLRLLRTLLCEGKVFRLGKVSARRFTGIQLANCWMMEINNNSFCWSVAGAVPGCARPLEFVCRLQIDTLLRWPVERLMITAV